MNSAGHSSQPGTVLYCTILYYTTEYQCQVLGSEQCRAEFTAWHCTILYYTTEYQCQVPSSEQCRPEFPAEDSRADQTCRPPGETGDRSLRGFLTWLLPQVKVKLYVLASVGGCLLLLSSFLLAAVLLHRRRRQEHKYLRQVHHSTTFRTSPSAFHVHRLLPGP